jgi:hypothetical protein
MAGELYIPNLTTGSSPGAIIWGQNRAFRWNGSAMVLSSSVAASAWSTGVVPLIEQQTSDPLGTGRYVGSFPSGIITAGEYEAEYFSTTIVTLGMQNIGTQTVPWTGSALATLLSAIVGGYAAGEDPAALLATAGYTGARAAYLDNIAAIKAKTDNLPTVPAAQGDVVDVWTTPLSEAYAATGEPMTPAEALHMIYAVCAQFAISGTSIVATKLDGSTTALTFTMDSATAPTERSRTG